MLMSETQFHLDGTNDTLPAIYVLKYPLANHQNE